MRLKFFNAMRLAYLLMDKSLGRLAGERVRQRFVQFAYRVKIKLFPEFGSFIPETTAIGPSAQNVPLFPPALPEWALEEMRDLAQVIDPALAPTPSFIASCQYYVFPVIPEPGEFYRKLLNGCKSAHYTHCFAIPWLKTGGADLVTLHHIHFIAKQANTSVLVIMTEPGSSPWRERLPSNVDVIESSGLIGRVAYDDIIRVLTRLIVQLKVDVLHIINSRHVWEAVSKHGLAITQNSRIYASIFCDDYDIEGYPVGFARQYLPQCYKHLTRVFSDNTQFPSRLCATYGYRPQLFTVINTPIDLSVKTTRKTEKHSVLWAGRLDRQKRPDLHFEIAQALPNVTFSVYGGHVLNRENSVYNKLSKMPNVDMHGIFDGVESLPFDSHSIFLYTSQWDGTPTIILAAAFAGIPVVASSVGGVADVVTDSTGYPIADIECIEDYINSINDALSKPERAAEKARLAQLYVRTKHSQMSFEQELRSIEGYLAPIGIEPLCDA